MTASEQGDVDKTLEEIQKTRTELGETVQALAAKTDIKARGREKTGRMTSRARQRVARTSGSARKKLTQLPKTAAQKISQKAKVGKRKALQIPTAVGREALQGAKAAGHRATSTAAAIRAAVHHVGNSVRRHPAPFVAGAIAGIALVAARRRRTSPARYQRRFIRR